MKIGTMGLMLPVKKRMKNPTMDECGHYLALLLGGSELFFDLRTQGWCQRLDLQVGLAHDIGFSVRVYQTLPQCVHSWRYRSPSAFCVGMIVIFTYCIYIIGAHLVLVSCGDLSLPE